jgi:outer membrane protein assembly factor BamB
MGLSILPARAYSQEFQTTPDSHNSPASPQTVFAGMRGRVLALDRAKGDVLWNTRLTGSEFVNLLLVSGDLYAATRGELFCLSIDNGQIRWHNKLKGYPHGLMTIITAESNGNQVAVMQEELRKEEEAAAAAIIYTSSS